MKTSRWIVGAFALLLGSGGAAEETHDHPVPEKLGTVVFPTTCAADQAHAIERAVALLHSFAYTASEAAFRQVADADPQCAIAHWGEAMSLVHLLWSPPGPADFARGQKEAQRAARIGAASERERGLIAAAAAYYGDGPAAPPMLRAQRYERAMATLAEALPDDTEVQVLHALALLGVAPPEDTSHAMQKRAAAILEPIYVRYPDHPGVAHYLIHAYDSAELAPRGLAAARAYAKIAPSAPHALHMPSHIFTRLGLWDDSIASNEAARRAAHAQGDVGEELHAMDYLVYAYLQRDRRADAERVVASLARVDASASGDFKVGYAATAMPVRLAMETGDWSAATALKPLPASAPHVQALVYWARAVAQTRSGHPESAAADIERLDACTTALDAAGNRYWSTQVGVLRKEAGAWQALALHRDEDAVAQMSAAADAEDALEKLPVTPGPIIPAREQLGDLLLSLQRPEPALQAYRQALVAAPGRRASLSGAARAADLLGDAGTAAQMRAKFVD